MYHGEIVEAFPAGARPMHPYTRELVAMTPVLGAPPPVVDDVVGADADPPDAGCAFAPRCRFADPMCGRAKPSLTEEADGRLIRCPVVLRNGGTH